MTKPEIMNKVHEKFKEKMKGRTYKPPIPNEVQQPLDVEKAAAEAMEERS